MRGTGTSYTALLEPFVVARNLIAISKAKLREKKKETNKCMTEVNATSSPPDRHFSTSTMSSTNQSLEESFQSSLRNRVQSYSPVSAPDQSQFDRYRLPGTNLSSQSSVDEGKSLRHAALIVEVRSEDSQLAEADKVTGVANDESLLLGEVGDATAVLEALGITVSNGGHDLVLDRFGHVLDGAVDEGSALAILSSQYVCAKEEKEVAGMSSPYLYPETTILELGHSVAALVRSLFISLMPPRSAPPGRKLVDSRAG